MSPRKSKLGRNPFDKAGGAKSTKAAPRKKSARSKRKPPGNVDLVSLLKTLQTKGLRALAKQIRVCAVHRAVHFVSTRLA